MSDMREAVLLAAEIHDELRRVRAERDEAASNLKLAYEDRNLLRSKLSDLEERHRRELERVAAAALSFMAFEPKPEVFAATVAAIITGVRLG